MATEGLELERLFDDLGSPANYVFEEIVEKIREMFPAYVNYSIVPAIYLMYHPEVLERTLQSEMLDRVRFRERFLPLRFEDGQFEYIIGAK